MIEKKVGTIEMSFWLTRINNRDKNIHIKIQNCLPHKIRQNTSFSYLTCASPLRKVNNANEHYRQVI